MALNLHELLMLSFVQSIDVRHVEIVRYPGYAVVFFLFFFFFLGQTAVILKNFYRHFHEVYGT